MYNISDKFKNHRLYLAFTKVKEKLAQHQFVCWVAGGAVRDFCLNRDVIEFDLVTDASVEILKILFPEAVLVGESFGVIKLPLADGEFFDLASFRQESDYRDGRRPSKVSCSTPTKDSERRDFTINAMYWDDEAQVIRDYQGGLADLSRHQLVCVGDAKIRFTEDYLRIIRLSRFAAQLDFEIENKTLEEALRLIQKIENVSGERIWSELKKIEKSSSWRFAAKQKLFTNILFQIFKAKGDWSFLDKMKSSKIDIAAFLSSYYPEQNLENILKMTLKISNAEFETYLQSRFWLNRAKQLPMEELVIEAERKQSLMECLKALVSYGLVDKNILETLTKLINENPKMLVEARDLLGVIPNQFISHELREIRLGQLSKKFRSTDEALAYLKKKYAQNV